MKDTIIKGTGNSRTLKSVPNLANLAPTYEDFLALLVGDGLPVDLGSLNAAGLSVRGTDLNKANLLTDATARLFGLTSTATPNTTFAKIKDLLQETQSDMAGKCNFVTGTYAGTLYTGSDDALDDYVTIRTPFKPLAGMIEIVPHTQMSSMPYGNFIAPGQLCIKANGYHGGLVYMDTTYSSNSIRFKSTYTATSTRWSLNQINFTYAYAIWG